MPGRLSVFDRAELATDVGPSPRNVAVLLVLDGPAPDVALVRERIARAVAQEPRLSEHVRRRGLAAPIWEPCTVDLSHHVRVRAAPGADPVAVAVEDLLRPMPPGRPPWRLTIVDLADPERSALIWTNGHVLGNGPSILGLLLDCLVDGSLAVPSRFAGRRLPAAGGDEPGRVVSRHVGRSGRSPLVRPVTAGLTAVPVDVDVDDLRSGAHACGATVNDALLWAWGRAFRRAHSARGGHGGRFVISVPVTSPGSRFGNDVGSLRVAVPEPDRPAAERLAELACHTRHVKRHIRPWTWAPAAAGAVLVRRLGLLPTVLRRQRLISTVVTYAPGPSEPLRVLGTSVVAVVPLVPVVGNVTALVAATSVGGRLYATVVCSPESADQARSLADDLAAGLRDIAAIGARPVSTH